MVQLPRVYTLELYDRPSAPLQLKIRMLRAEVLENMLYGCVTWSSSACNYDTLRRAHHRFLTRCIRYRKHNRADHPISYLDTLIETGGESIEATLRWRRILFAGFVARMEDTRLPKCVMLGELVGGADCVRGQEKEWMGCFLDDFRAFGINADVDDCSPGRGGMARDGETRDGTFHGEMDRCSENQGWTMACSRMPERDGKDQGEDIPKQVVLVRSPLLTSHKWSEFVSSGHLICRCHVDFLWCYVCFVLFRFRLHTFIEAAALRSIVVRYAGAPTAKRVSFFFPSCFFGDVAFCQYFVTIAVSSFVTVYRVRRTFFPARWCFSTSSLRAGFFYT